MALWKLIFLSIITIVHSQSSQDIIGERYRKIQRMVNGQDAKPGEFPYLVSLQYKIIDQHFCGGAILNDHFIITAAHCVAKVWVNDIQVVVGTVDLKQPKSIHNAISVTAHESFSLPQHLVNDIALVKVDPPIQFDKLVAPIALPSANYVFPENSKVNIAGWGTTIDPKKERVTKLKKVKGPVVDQDGCIKLYKNYEKPIFEKQFCTHETGPQRKGVCTGDSGGPVVINNILVGIVSWSTKDPKCASPKYPDVHTRVSSFVDWIKKHAV